MKEKRPAFTRWADENITPVGSFDDTYPERLRAARAGWDAATDRIMKIATTVFAIQTALSMIVFIILALAFFSC